MQKASVVPRPLRNLIGSPHRGVKSPENFTSWFFTDASLRVSYFPFYLKLRMRTKPFGSRCSRKRDKNSSSDKVISFCSLVSRVAAAKGNFLGIIVLICKTANGLRNHSVNHRLVVVGIGPPRT
jgi:hypothetical protein